MNNNSQLPLIALVGRPNVGKSTLFNKMLGRRASLVADFPGVTRDRVMATAHHDDALYQLVDTGGFVFDSYEKKSLQEEIAKQADLAIAAADFVVLVLDGKTGLHPDDHAIVKRLRRAKKPFMAVGNKIDSQKHDMNFMELQALGVSPMVAVSAEHSLGLDDLWQEIAERVQAPKVDSYEAKGPVAITDSEQNDALTANPTESLFDAQKESIYVAVVGRPNVGKSSLVNALLGEERLVTSDVAGTTRDSVDVSIQYNDQGFVFVDTAGLRKKRMVVDALEHYAALMSVRSLERADVVLLVLDAARPVAEQDSKILALVEKHGKGIVIVVNKSDLLTRELWATYREQLQRSLSFMPYAHIVKVSAKDQFNLERLFPAIVAVQRERFKRVKTAELNQFFRSIVESNPPPFVKGKRPKLYYVSQPFVAPPTFIFAASLVDRIHASYNRFLQNALRERYGFQGTPLWIKFRERSNRNKKKSS